ncbi:MAG: hypothetical protein HWE25_12370 [Alphaproteobacteria bacterium]|nr:hypothetical protein [Alphaproteobacteria bacterium]
MGATGPAPEPVATPTEPQVQPAPEPATPAPSPANPDRLVGANPKAVIDLMGEPSLMRRDGTVQVMLFETTSCVFEVVFMEPHADAHFAATHLAARTRTGADTDLQACLASILPDGTWPDGS